MNYEKDLQLIENEEFVKKLENSETLEEAKNVFLENGVNVDVDVMKNDILASNKELDETDLENVAGGGIIQGALFGWNLGKALGIIARTLYEDKKGMSRTYSWSQIKWAMNFIG